MTRNAKPNRDGFDTKLGAYLDHLRALLDHPTVAACGVSVRDLVGSSTSIAFEPLPQDDKVVVRGSTLVVDDSYPRGLAASGKAHEEQLALLVLYVVHEAVHVVQGLGAKAAVTRLRGTGHEDELMHLDLQADHVALLIVNQLFPTWGLHWLRDVQSRSIRDFPTTPGHSATSRLRKVMRFVGLRLGYLVHRHRPELIGAEGYVYAMFGGHGGPLQVFVNGTVRRLLFETTLSMDTTRDLLTALDPGHELSCMMKLDGILMDLLPPVTPRTGTRRRWSASSRAPGARGPLRPTSGPARRP